MESKLTPLIAQFNENDKRLAAAAIYSHAMERLDASRSQAPLNYGARRSRDRYLHALTDRERALRKSTSEMRNWKVIFRPSLQAVPLAEVFEGKSAVPPQGIRFLSGNWNLYLIKLIGRLSMSKGALAQTVRLELRFDPAARGAVKHASAMAIFPRNEWKRYGAGDFLFGLRPNLKFWVPTTQDGMPFMRGMDMPRRVKKLFLVGPEKASFRRIGIEGRSVGDSRVEWQMNCTVPFRSSGLRMWIVLQVPTLKRRIQVQAVLEAEALMPQALASLVGQRRLVRDRRNWLWRLPLPRASIL
jgi:hypothetical protein